MHGTSTLYNKALLLYNGEIELRLPSDCCFGCASSLPSADATTRPQPTFEEGGTEVTGDETPRSLPPTLCGEFTRCSSAESHARTTTFRLSRFMDSTRSASALLRSLCCTFVLRAREGVAVASCFLEPMYRLSIKPPSSLIEFDISSLSGARLRTCTTCDQCSLLLPRRSYFELLVCGQGGKAAVRN